MTSASIKAELPLIEPGKQLDSFTVAGHGLSRYVLCEASVPQTSELAVEGTETLVVTDPNWAKIKAIIALREVDTGKPLVDIIEVGDELETKSNLLPKILSATMNVAHAQRLRLSTEATNVPLQTLKPFFGLDPIDPSHTTYIYPRNSFDRELPQAA